MIPPTDSTPPAPVAWIEFPDQSTLPLNGDVHIGRIEGNEIVNPDSRISRRHAVIQRQGDRYALVDLGSTNGTYLNDARIFTARKLKHGDVILVGSLKYIFHQPSLTEVSGVSDSAQHTVVAVGKASCWMLLVLQPKAAGPIAWVDPVMRDLAASGARVKKLSGASILAHWREGAAAPERVAAALRQAAQAVAPAGARLALHFGPVRVGPAAVPGEENLLGPEVTWAHKLGAAAAAQSAPVLVSEAAARSLGPSAALVPLGAQAVADLPGVHPLFGLAPA